MQYVWGTTRQPRVVNRDLTAPTNLCLLDDDVDDESRKLTDPKDFRFARLLGVLPIAVRLEILQFAWYIGVSYGLANDISNFVIGVCDDIPFEPYVERVCIATYIRYLYGRFRFSFSSRTSHRLSDETTSPRSRESSGGGGQEGEVEGCPGIYLVMRNFVMVTNQRSSLDLHWVPPSATIHKIALCWEGGLNRPPPIDIDQIKREAMYYSPQVLLERRLAREGQPGYFLPCVAQSVFFFKPLPNEKELRAPRTFEFRDEGIYVYPTEIGYTFAEAPARAERLPLLRDLFRWTCLRTIVDFTWVSPDFDGEWIRGCTSLRYIRICGTRMFPTVRKAWQYTGRRCIEKFGVSRLRNPEVIIQLPQIVTVALYCYQETTWEFLFDYATPNSDSLTSSSGEDDEGDVPDAVMVPELNINMDLARLSSGSGSGGSPSALEPNPLSVTLQCFSLMNDRNFDDSHLYILLSVCPNLSSVNVHNTLVTARALVDVLALNNHRQFILMRDDEFEGVPLDGDKLVRENERFENDRMTLFGLVGLREPEQSGVMKLVARCCTSVTNLRTEIRRQADLTTLWRFPLLHSLDVCLKVRRAQVSTSKKLLREATRRLPRLTRLLYRIPIEFFQGPEMQLGDLGPWVRESFFPTLKNRHPSMEVRLIDTCLRLWADSVEDILPTTEEVNGDLDQSQFASADEPPRPRARKRRRITAYEEDEEEEDGYMRDEEEDGESDDEEGYVARPPPTEADLTALRGFVQPARNGFPDGSFGEVGTTAYSNPQGSEEYEDDW